MKKQLLIVVFIGFFCGSINVGGVSGPVPQFSTAEARMMQVGGGSLVVPKNPGPGVQQIRWSWNESQYVGVPVGAPAPAPAAGPMTQAQMQAAVAADPNGAAAAAQTALNALAVVTTGTPNASIMSYIG